MQSPGWMALVVCTALISACGPNAARVTLDAASTPIAQTSVTPVAWKIEPTPTPGPPTKMPLAITQPMPTPQGGFAPTVVPPSRPAPPTGQVLPQAAGAPATVAPTAGVVHAPFPTPTQTPPVQCQFGNETISVPARDAVAVGITPGAVPTLYQGVPGLTTVASGEPLPGVSLELRLPGTTLAAGAVIQAEIRVQNTTAAEVLVSDSVSVAPDGQDQPTPGQADPRSFAVFAFGPRFGGLQVPAGQTWAIPSATIQLPFDAAQPVHLHAAVGLATGEPAHMPEPSLRVVADSPVRLVSATAVQQLHLQVHADHSQWCVRATDAAGKRPVSPLYFQMEARGPSAGMFGGPASAVTDDTWAARWDPNTFPPSAPMTVAFWVGGPNYVTARADATVSPGP